MHGSTISTLGTVLKAWDTGFALDDGSGDTAFFIPWLGGQPKEGDKVWVELVVDTDIGCRPTLVCKGWFVWPAAGD